MPTARPDVAVHDRLQADTLERWGVRQCHLVDRVALESGLRGLLEIDPPPDEDPPRMLARLQREAGQDVLRHLEDALALARTGQRTHSSDDVWPHGIADELDDLLQDLEAHDAREAYVRGLVDEAAAAFCNALHEEHALIADRLASLRMLTRDYETPAHACTVWRLLYVLCLKVEAALVRRMGLEECPPGPSPQSYGDASLSARKASAPAAS